MQSQVNLGLVIHTDATFPTGVFISQIYIKYRSSAIFGCVTGNEATHLYIGSFAISVNINDTAFAIQSIAVALNVNAVRFITLNIYNALV